MTGITIHFISDFIHPNAWTPYLDYLADTHQEVVQIMGGTQLNWRNDFVVAVRKRLPDITIMMRHWPDDGRHARTEVKDWFDWLKTDPYTNLSFMKEHNVVLMWDNESSGNDAVMRAYAAKTVEALNRCAEVGQALGVLRTPLGTPDMPQYPLLEAVCKTVMKLQDTPYAPWITPNEGMWWAGGNRQAQRERNAEVPHRFAHYWQLCEPYGPKRPKTTIGEWGWAEGWRSLGLSEEAALAEAIPWFEQWYWPYGVSVAWYCAGGGTAEWDNYRLSLPMLKRLTQYHLEVLPKIQPPVVSPPLPEPDPLTTWRASVLAALDTLKTLLEQMPTT